MKIVYGLIVAAVVVTSCNNNKNATADSSDSTSNPFFQKSTLTYQAPDFTKIKDADFKPAMEKGIDEQMKEIDSIANDAAAPTFENTLVPLEKSGELLHRVSNVFDLLTGANTNPTLQGVQEEMAPKLAALNDAIFLNKKLFVKVNSINDGLSSSKLDPESKKLVEYYYQKFVMAGSKLSDAQQDSLKKINGQLATLSAQFTNQLLAASKDGALIVDNKEALAGLSDEAIKAAGNNPDYKGKFVLSLQNTTQQPPLKSLTNRDTRKKLFENSYNRAEKGDANDTRKTILEIARLRAVRAKILGFDNYAAWNLQDQMAKTPAAVQKFLDGLIPAATAKAKSEAAEIQSVIDKQKGGFKLEAYDWNLYAEQVRKAKYDLDDNEVKPYFELNKVLQNGVFYSATQLYGITFKERKDLPVYQEDVKVFELFDQDKKSFGLFYCDYFKRDNKSGGAWMSNIVNQSTLLGTNPVIYNVCNFTKPAAGEPALISYDDVTTMFHEFGHALHGFLPVKNTQVFQVPA
nr:M3 family metallopeptidase [Pedobacter psychrophilus]